MRNTSQTADSLAIDQIVTWTFGTHHPLTLTGKITDISGDTAQVVAHGTVHEVPLGKLKLVYTCLSCDKPLKGRPSMLRDQRYCSVECRYADLHKDYDEWVFQFIIDHKTKYDGWSPALPTIAKAVGLAEVTTRRTLRRLAKQGRIQIVGNGFNQCYIVKGGRWVYEGS